MTDSDETAAAKEPLSIPQCAIVGGVIACFVWIAILVIGMVAGGVDMSGEFIPTSRPGGPLMLSIFSVLPAAVVGAAIGLIYGYLRN